MPTDVMHDETCRVLAGVLARRNAGVQQLTLTTDDIRHDLAHLEEIATLSGRPVLHNVVQAFESRPHVHRRAIEWLERCRERGIPVYGQGVTTDAGFTFTFEDWNLYDDSDAWMEATTGSVGERLAKLADPDRRQGLKDQPPTVATAPHRDGHRAVAPLAVHGAVPGDVGAPGRRRHGQAPRRRHARHRRHRRAAHPLLRRPAAGHVGPAQGDRAVPAHALRRVRRGRPHEVPDRRSLSHRDAGPTGPRQPVDHLRGGPPATVRAAGPAGRASTTAGCCGSTVPPTSSSTTPSTSASGPTRSSRTCPAASGDASRRPPGTTPCSSTGCAPSPTTPRPNGTRAGCCATAGADRRCTSPTASGVPARATSASAPAAGRTGLRSWCGGVDAA